MNLLSFLVLNNNEIYKWKTLIIVKWSKMIILCYTVKLFKSKISNIYLVVLLTNISNIKSQ